MHGYHEVKSFYFKTHPLTKEGYKLPEGWKPFASMMSPSTTYVIVVCRKWIRIEEDRSLPKSDELKAQLDYFETYICPSCSAVQPSPGKCWRCPATVIKNERRRNELHKNQSRQHGVS